MPKRSRKAIIEELKKISSEEYQAPSHWLTDSSVQWDDLCDECNWYREHFEKLKKLIQELNETYKTEKVMLI